MRLVSIVIFALAICSSTNATAQTFAAYPLGQAPMVTMYPLGQAPMVTSFTSTYGHRIYRPRQPYSPYVVVPRRVPPYHPPVPLPPRSKVNARWRPFLGGWVHRTVWYPYPY